MNVASIGLRQIQKRIASTGFEKNAKIQASNFINKCGFFLFTDGDNGSVQLISFRGGMIQLFLLIYCCLYTTHVGFTTDGEFNSA